MLILYIPFPISGNRAQAETSDVDARLMRCRPKVWFTECNSSPDKPIIHYNTLSLVVEISVQKGCKASDLYNYWSLRDKASGALLNQYPKRRNKHTVLINKYQLDPGDYVLIAHLRETAIFSLDVWVEAKCYIRIISRCPIPVISNGLYITVPKGIQITLSSSRSITCALDVEYTWKCTSSFNSKSCLGVNGKKGSEVGMFIDGNIGDIYRVTVWAKAEKALNESFTQVLNITGDHTPAISIRCLKNCLTAGSVLSNTVVPVLLKAFCYHDCGRIKHYKWDLKPLTETVHTVEEILQNGTYKGTETDQLLIEADWLGFSEKYEVHLLAIGENEQQLAEAMVFIDMTSNIGGEAKCVTSHNGKSGLQREYLIKCSVPSGPRPTVYKLQQMIHNPLTGELIACTLAHDFDAVFRVKLGSSGNSTLQTLVFIAMDDTMIMTNSTFRVDVPRPFGDLPSNELILKLHHALKGLEGTEPVKNLMRRGKVSLANQIINVLYCEAAKLDLNEPGIAIMRINSQIRLLGDIMEVRRNLITDMEYFLALLPHLVVHKSKELFHSKMRSKLCLWIAKAIAESLEVVVYPTAYHEYIELHTVPLQQCANYYLDDDYSKPYMFNISLPDPIPEHLVIQEDYPNYGEKLDEFSVEDLKEIFSNALGTINTVSEMYANTFVYGEPRVYINYSANTSIDITRSMETNRLAYEDGAIKVVLPDDLGLKPDETVRIIYTILTSDTFFWDQNDGNKSARIINLKMYGPSGREITTVPGKIHVYLKLTSQQSIVDQNTSMVIPLEDVEWNEEFVQRYMKLFRVDVDEFHSLLTTIDEMQPIKRLRMAITKLRKPTRADFVLVSTTEERLYVFNTSATDTWYYVGFLPFEEDIKEMISKNSSKISPSYHLMFNDDYTISLNTYNPEMLKIHFEYGFTAVTCKEWSGEMWDVNHCEVGTDGDDHNMHCICSEVSTLVADTLAVKTREQKTLFLDYELTLTVNPVLIILTAILFALYCITICFVYFRKNPLRLYFLGDNLEEDRYAYLVITQTAPYYDCSTTSNVTVKLYGDKFESKSHVLNYPDPNLQILQDGRLNMFVLTTTHHLGNLLKMEIWYDAIGPKYTWYCEYVKVYDLQSPESEWFFNVRTRFTVLNENGHFITVYPCDGTNWVFRRHLHTYLRFDCTASHSWIFWNRRDDRIFTFMERVSLLFCEIICSLAFALAILGRPAFTRRDGLGVHYFDSFTYILGYTVAVAIFVFAMFAPLSIVLRYSKKIHTRRQIFIKEEVIFSQKVTIFCWAYMAVSATIAIVYLIFFGFWISYITSLMVFTITALSLCMNAILLENMKLIVLKIATGFFIEVNGCTSSAIVAESERQRKFLYRKLGPYGLRPYLTHLYKPLTKEKLWKSRAQKEVEYNIGKSVSEMAFFYLYTSMLFLVLLTKLDPLAYTNSKHVSAMVLNGSQRNKPVATRVRTFEDLYLYLNNTLVHVIHPMSWYGDWHASEPGLLDDFATKILGVVRIRQKRVHDRQRCVEPSFSNMLNISLCYPEYRLKYRDTFHEGVSKSMWSYQTAEVDNYQIGHFHSYDGSGFILELGRNLNNTYYLIELMKSSHWLDRRTRAVFIEFWTYNTNQNLFTAVNIMFERSATQLMQVSDDVFSLKLIPTHPTSEILTTVVFTIFCLLIFKLVLRYIRRTIKHRLKILFHLSNLWEITIIITNITIVVLHLKKHYEHIMVFRSISQSKLNDFISYFDIMTVYQDLQTVTGILFAFAIARGLTFMKFVKAFRIFEKTLVLSIGSFMAVSVFTGVLICMFATSGHVMFGAHTSTFWDMEQSVVSLMKRSVDLPSSFSGGMAPNVNMTIGILFYCLFCLCITVTKNIFISTTIVFLRISRTRLAQTEHHYSLSQYVIDKWSYYAELLRRHGFRCRLKGGADVFENQVIAIPKVDEIRYADAITITDLKLQYMLFLTRDVIRRMFVIQDEFATTADVDRMRKIVIGLLWKNDDEVLPRSIFFIGRTATGRQKVVSNNKLLTMEYIVNYGLTKRGNPTDKDSLKRMEDIEKMLGTVNDVLGNISIKTRKRHGI
ncbi:hypothetical protein Trydic_g13397 [Trypoxylus dichotomus]